MIRQIQPQEQNQALIVQAQWFATAITVITGILTVIDTVSTVVKSVKEVREAEKK